MFYPTRRQAVVGSLLAFGASAAISFSGTLDGESSKSPERLSIDPNKTALIRVSVGKGGDISGIAVSMEVQKCLVSDEGIQKAERGVPPALGDLACLGNAQVAQK